MSPKFGDIACSVKGHSFRYDVKLMYLGPTASGGDSAWFLVVQDDDPKDGWPVGRVIDGRPSVLRTWQWIDGNAPVT